MARRFRRARRVYSRVKRYGKRHSTMGGITGDLMTGAATGALVTFAGPTINRSVPRIGPLSPMTVTTLGAGAALKMMRKGGKFSDALLILGSAGAASDLMSGMGSGTTATAGVASY